MLKQTAALSPSSFLRKEPALRSGLPDSSRHTERQRRISVKIASGKNINKYQSAGRQTYSQGSAQLLSEKGAGRYVPQGHTISKIKILPLSYKAAGFLLSFDSRTRIISSEQPAAVSAVHFPVPVWPVSVPDS